MAETKIVVNYEQIIQKIGEELQDVWRGLKDLEGDETAEIRKQISNIKAIEISDEQSFVKKEKTEKLLQGTLYIAIKFGPGATNYGSSVSPISLYCVGTANKVKPAQILLGVFASSWTTKNLSQDLIDSESGESLEVKDMLQVWNTPEIVTNFNEIDADFKNLFRLTGNIVIGQSAVRVGTLTYYWGSGENDFEQLSIMSFQDGYRASLDSQPFGNTQGFAKSEVNFSTYTFTISTYLLNNSYLAAAALSLRGFRNRNVSTTLSPNPFAIYTKGLGGTVSQNDTYFRVGKNDYFKIKIELTNGFTNAPFVAPSGSDVPTEVASLTDEVLASDFFLYYKVVDSQIGQELAGLPSLTMSFTR